MSLRFIALVSISLAAVPAVAQNMALGLWEMSVQGPAGVSDAAVAKLQERLAAMSPEKRKQVEEMLARPSIATGAKGGTARMCVNQAQADRGDIPEVDRRCKQENLQRSGNKVKFKFSCTGDPPSSGEGEYVFNSDKAYKGRMLINTTRSGKPQRIEMQIAGRHLAADCGDVKPRP